MGRVKRGKFVYKNEDGMMKMQEFYDKTLASLCIPYTEDFFDTSFGKTHCLVVGDTAKPRICTIHGGNGITTLNLKLFLPLLDKYCLLAPDVIGMPGKSDPYRNISSQKDEYGLWIREVLDHYNADEISFAVSSYSSAMFLSFAKRYPKRVKSALLLVPSGIAHGPILPMMGKMVVPFLKYYLRPSEKTLDAVIETMGGKGDPVWREFFDLMMSSYKMEMKPPREYTKYELASFKAPLLIIASENDIFFPAKKVFRKAKEIFTGPVSTYKIDSKHLPSDETMIYVCKRTEEFLNTIEITDGYFYDEPTNILHNDEFYEKQYVVLTDKNDNGRMWKGYIYYHLNIGSDKRCDITIPTDYDDSVKPLHCRIVKKTDSSFYVAVLAISAMNNDTRLNGRPVGVDDPCQIHEGDELSVGSHTYIVDFE